MVGILLIAGAALVAFAFAYVLVQSYRRSTAWDWRRETKRVYRAWLDATGTTPASRPVRRSGLGSAPGKSRRRWFVPPRS